MADDQKKTTSMQVKDFIDDEAGVSGDASEDEENEDETLDDSPSIDAADVDIDMNDIDDHRAVLNRLQRGNLPALRKLDFSGCHPSPGSSPPSLKRTDTDQNLFARRSHDITYGWPPRTENPSSTTTTMDPNDCMTWKTRCTWQTPCKKCHEAAKPAARVDVDLTEFYADDLHNGSPTPPTQIDNLPDIPPPTNTTGNVFHDGRKFKMRNKLIGLTYPQCPVDPSTMLHHLQGLLSKQDADILVAQEDHKSTEGKHLHVYISASTAITTCNERFFDYTEKDCTTTTTTTTAVAQKVYHPNIQIVKNRVNWLRYVTKGENWVATPGFDVQSTIGEIQKKKTPVTSKIANAILKGATVPQIAQEYPGFTLLHYKQVREFAQQAEIDKEVRANKTKWASVIRFEGIDTTTSGFTNARIAGWLNDNVIKEHKFRMHNMWIKAYTKAGKTTLIENLQDLGLNVLIVDCESGFYDGISDSTQLLVFDEFKAQKKITEMNKLCDGSRCRLNLKGSSYQMRHPIPVIVLSNFTINEAYHKSDQQHLETLVGRFIHLEIKQPDRINVRYVGLEHTV